MRWCDSGEDEENGRWKTRPGYEMAGPRRGQRSRMTIDVSLNNDNIDTPIPSVPSYGD